MRLVIMLCLSLAIAGCGAYQTYQKHRLDQDHKEATQKINDLIDNSFEKEKAK